MPLDPAFGFAMVVFFFEDWLHHEYYSYAGNMYMVEEGGKVHWCISVFARKGANKNTARGEKIRKTLS